MGKGKKYAVCVFYSVSAAEVVVRHASFRRNDHSVWSSCRAHLDLAVELILLAEGKSNGGTMSGFMLLALGGWPSQG